MTSFSHRLVKTALPAMGLIVPRVAEIIEKDFRR